MAHLIQSHIAPLSNDPTQDAMSQPSDGSSDVTHVAQILTIDVSRLQEGDKAEAAKLFKASKEDGVFYLDFSDQKCMKMIEAAGNVFDLMKELFHLSDEEKMKYDIDLLGRLKLNG